MDIVGKVQSTQSTPNTLSIHNSNTPLKKNRIFTYFFYIFLHDEIGLVICAGICRK